MTRRIAVVGLPFYAERASAGLREIGFDAHHLPRPGKSPTAWARLASGLARADLVYAIGSSVALRSPADLIERARRPILMHWVGSDVQAALADHRAGRVSRSLIASATHWADAPWLADELRPLGIEAAEHPLPIPTTIGSPLPLPEEFRVLVYLPANPHAAYDVESSLDVVQAMPEVSFIVFGGFVPDRAPANLEVAGFQSDMPALYRRGSVLLRLTSHDGLSHSVIEALSFGRHVLWTYPLAGVRRVSGPGNATAALAEMHRAFTEGNLKPNAEGARLVTQRYGWDTIRQEVREGIDRLIRD